MVGKTIKVLSNRIMREMENGPLREEHRRITGMQRWMLGYLNHQPEGAEIFQRDVEKEFNIRRSTASGILRLMEKNGLIERLSVDSDARLKRIVVTERARDFHRMVEDENVRMEDILTRGFSDGELAEFFRITDRISKNLDEAALLTEKAKSEKNED